MYALWRLTCRNWKIFIKDKANVFFALLAPLIVLVLYVLILGKLQVDGLLSALDGMGVTGGRDAVQAFCDCWMLAGALSCAGITVPLCACGIMIQDRSRGIAAEYLASPVPRWMPALAYFCSVVLAGLFVGVIVLGVCFVWLALAGSWYLSVLDVLGCLGTLILSVLSSSTLLVFVVGFFKSQGAFTGLNVIVGTILGFLIGAYMPITYFPKGVQYFTLFIPGSYSAGLFRNCIMRGALEQIAATLSEPFAASLEKEFSMKFDFFGTELGVPAMACVLAASVVLFALLLFALSAVRLRKNQ